MADKNIPRQSADIAGALHSAAIHLLRKLRRRDAASGLNAPRLSALSVVVFAGPVTLGELAAAEQVRPPTMTRIVDALVSRKLATKRKSASDGRSIQIAATTAGKRLLVQGRKRRVGALTAQVAALSQHERARLGEAAAILERIIPRI